MNELDIQQKKLFDDIKHVDENGVEFWYARELQGALQYKEWRNLQKVISTAQIACKISQQSVSDHFVEVNKLITAAKGAQRKVTDYKLTRYACYLIVMNGDPRKEVIALGQTYFITKTFQRELTETIITQKEYATFQDAGYRGLYGGMTAKDIAEHKGLTNGEEILDYMGGTELAANLFRITQTEEKMKREGTDTPAKANATHYQVGKAVRATIESLGGTMPEDLPTPDKSIQQLEAEQRKLLGKQLGDKKD
jgi:DNA-damage-inducible protein D